MGEEEIPSMQIQFSTYVHNRSLRHRGTSVTVDHYMKASGRHLLHKSVRRKYRRMPDPLAYYHEHFAGCTRGQLQQCDPALYHTIRRCGLLKNVPKKSARVV